MTKTHLQVAFPHEGACAKCREARRCNYCGALDAYTRSARCTNGRCMTCHVKVCTPGGVTSEGHGFGQQGEPWRYRAEQLASMEAEHTAPDYPER